MDYNNLPIAPTQSSGSTRSSAPVRPVLAYVLLISDAITGAKVQLVRVTKRQGYAQEFNYSQVTLGFKATRVSVKPTNEASNLCTILCKYDAKGQAIPGSGGSVTRNSFTDADLDAQLAQGTPAPIVEATAKPVRVRKHAKA